MKEFIIFDSAIKAKKPFQPISKNEINMYVCGMTVYADCHIGHARLMLFFDTVANIFKHFGYKVNYIRNITDIDDKIINKATAENITWQELTHKVIQSLNKDNAILNISSPTFEPKATESIQEIIALIEILISKKHAYIAADKDVYFAAKSFANYGKLSNQDLTATTANVRKELSTNKLDDLDFILWKQAKPNEPFWESPWGNGRPGWHIECSAMAKKFNKNKVLDIHGGGIDLKFPHHENEKAQTEAAYEHKFVNHWMHVGHVTVDSVKMSKSLNNFATVSSLTKKFHPEVIRLFLLSTHYRNPLNFNQESLLNSKLAILSLYKVLDTNIGDIDNALIQEFEAALLDDFNIPQAIAVCFKLAKNKNATSLKKCLNTLKLGNTSSKEIQEYNITINEAEINELIKQRAVAKQNKNWELADQLRDKLQAKNIILEDTSKGTIWKYQD
jgi:cysteinyl-tRNA synthetase